MWMGSWGSSSLGAGQRSRRPSAAKRLEGLDRPAQGLDLGAGQGGAGGAPGLLGAERGGQVVDAEGVALAGGVIGEARPGLAGGEDVDALFVGGELDQRVLGFAIGRLHRL